MSLRGAVGGTLAEAWGADDAVEAATSAFRARSQHDVEAKELGTANTGHDSQQEPSLISSHPRMGEGSTVDSSRVLG